MASKPSAPANGATAERELKAEIGVPKNLTAAGVDKKNLEKLVAVATEDACHPNNPRAVTKQDFHAIFSEAF